MANMKIKKENLVPCNIPPIGSRVIEVFPNCWLPVGEFHNETPEVIPSGGAFDLVKVTEYSPYVPAYPPQKGYDITFVMKTYGDGGDYDSSAYHGVYTVTEETKGCTSYGRVYKNANGKFLYSWNDMQYEQGTDDSDPSNLCWCVSDNLGGGTYSALACTNFGSTDLTTASWNSMNYQLDSATCTEVQTSEATEAIPMVLKGSKCTAYDVDAKAWTVAESVQDLTGFEKEPEKYGIYTTVSKQLIGNLIMYDSDSVLISPVDATSNEFNGWSITARSWESSKDTIYYAFRDGQMYYSANEHNTEWVKITRETPFLVNRIFLSSGLRNDIGQAAEVVDIYKIDEVGTETKIYSVNMIKDGTDSSGELLFDTISCYGLKFVIAKIFNNGGIASLNVKFYGQRIL